VGAALTPTGTGYWLATRLGKVDNHGDAVALGSTPTVTRPIVGSAAAR
jgi:hypothetical protein